MKNLIFILIYLLGFHNNIYSKTYYINSDEGNDSNSGLRQKDAWKSILKVNRFKFNPGDSILFKSGCTWREEVVISSNGKKENPIYFGSYGRGAKPKIFGSNNDLIWIKQKDEIWSAKITETPGWLWFVKNNNIIWGNKKNRIDQLKKEFDFLVSQNNVYIFSSDNPEQYLSVEYSVRDFGIISGWYNEGSDNIEIENFEIAFTKNANIRGVGCSSWEIKNIISHHCGGNDESEGQGIQFEGDSGIFRNNTLFENGQHGFFLSSFGKGIVGNNVIEKNTIFNNFHTGIDIMNDGGSKCSHKNTIVRQNLIYDTQDFNGQEIGIQTLGINGGLINNVVIHHNVVLNTNGIGISIMNNSDTIFVHNNTIINSESACINIDNNSYYAEVINNVGVNNLYYAVFFIHNLINKTVDYNCWYSSSPNTKLIFADNKFYTSISLFSKSTGLDLHSFSEDPMIVFDSKDKIEIDKNSKLNEAGKQLKYCFDFYDRLITNKLNIGAVE